MIANMFTIAWRNAIRHKQFSLLNILGLSIGITTTLLITLYVMGELSYDNFHEKGDRIYRINQPMIWGDWNQQFASTGPNLAVGLRADIPEFEEVTRLHTRGDHVVTYKPESGQLLTFQEGQVYVAEENFFDIFTFPAVKGDLSTALEAPGSIVITAEMATKYFGDKDPLGETLTLQLGGKSDPFKVTAVVQDTPENSHIEFDMLTSMSTFRHIKNREHQWIWTTFVTYGLVKDGVNVKALEEKIQQIPPKWAETETQRVFGMSFEEYIGERKWSLFMQPLKEAYIYSPPSGNRIGPSGNILYVRIFTAVGILILLLSCINFMNLSTARSANRAKEVGIRKVLGSEKRSLVRQFIFESILYVSISTVIAIVLTEVFLGSFNTIADTQLSLYEQLMNPVFVTALIAFILILGIAAGSYPAFYLSSFKPIEVLKGKLSGGFKGKAVRNGLVVFQFTISAVLIICTFFVQKQLQYTASADLGFDKSNILQIHNIELLSETNKETLQTILKGNSAFEQVGMSDLVPPSIWNEDKYKAYGPDTEIITLNRLRSTEEYMDLLDLKFLDGRNFDKTRGTDKYKVILNETAVRILGWEGVGQDPNNSPVGKYVTLPDSQEALFEVIGVVEDFNFNSVRYEISPLLIIHEDNDILYEMGSDFVSIRLNPNIVTNSTELQRSLDYVETKLEELNSGIPFEYSFMDQRFEASFRNEQRMGQVLNIFTAMAMVIACLGLFGLAAFSAEQRKKELGVRKVLGASIFRLVYMFTSEFTLLIMISLVIASPVAYFFVKQWLAGFAYKTPIHFWVFILAALGSLVIAWLTIGFQSVKAAHQNPVDVLRDE